MAGETAKREAICLDIRPWSRTSHIVTWLTPTGKVVTSVKGANRPKSPFLGQYDLNYACEIVYYLRARGEIHALRECSPLRTREHLRSNCRALILAGYLRSLTAELAPQGPDCGSWHRTLEQALERLQMTVGRQSLLALMLGFELDLLGLAGIRPNFSGVDRNAEWSPFSLERGAFLKASEEARGRLIRVAPEVAKYLEKPDAAEKNLQIPLDAARVIGVFYTFHLDCAPDVRRSVLGLISQNEAER